jgi:hypothetical protein
MGQDEGADCVDGTQDAPWLRRTSNLIDGVEPRPRSFLKAVEAAPTTMSARVVWWVLTGASSVPACELLDQWYGPTDTFFKVRANDGNVSILRRRSSAPEGDWSLESFRDMRRGG